MIQARCRTPQPTESADRPLRRPSCRRTCVGHLVSWPSSRHCPSWRRTSGRLRPSARRPWNCWSWRALRRSRSRAGLQPDGADRSTPHSWCPVRSGWTGARPRMWWRSPANGRWFSCIRGRLHRRGPWKTPDSRQPCEPRTQSGGQMTGWRSSRPVGPAPVWSAAALNTVQPAASRTTPVQAGRRRQTARSTATSLRPGSGPPAGRCPVSCWRRSSWPRMTSAQLPAGAQQQQQQQQQRHRQHGTHDYATRRDGVGLDGMG